MEEETNSLPPEFLMELKKLEESYLAETDPIRQSGFIRGQARWRRERRFILNAVGGDGDFLDVGRANGYLVSVRKYPYFLAFRQFLSWNLLEISNGFPLTACGNDKFGQTLLSSMPFKMGER